MVHVRAVDNHLAHSILWPRTQLTARVRSGVQGRNLDSLANDVRSFVNQDAVTWLHQFHCLVDSQQRSSLASVIFVITVCGHMNVFGHNGRGA